MNSKKTDLMGNEIKANPAWKGSNCSFIFNKDKTIKDPKFSKYLENCPKDSKNRLHYYVKSYYLSKILSEAKINTVFHIGFGKERYLYSYKYQGIQKVMGCDIDRETNGGSILEKDFKQMQQKYSLVINKDFLQFSPYETKKIKNEYISNGVVISESTFYWLTGYDYGSWKTHLKCFSNLSKKDIAILIEKFKQIIIELRNIGFNDFVFIEQDHDMFKNLFNDLRYEKIKMNDDFKFEFLLDYDNLVENVIHIYSNNDNLINKFSCFR